MMLFVVEGLSENSEPSPSFHPPRLERPYIPTERQSNVCSAEALNLVLSSDCLLTFINVDAHEPTPPTRDQFPAAQLV